MSDNKKYIDKRIGIMASMGYSDYQIERIIDVCNDAYFIDFYDICRLIQPDLVKISLGGDSHR